MLIKCPICNKEFNCCPSRLENSKSQPCCSRECSKELKYQLSLNCACDYCGKRFHKKPSHIEKNKYNYCSMECLRKHRAELYQGENNPNAFCRIQIRQRKKHCGYYWVYLPDHPFATKDGYIREHRLIAEKYLLTNENTAIINGEKFLSPNFEVHHKDLNKLNNDKDNLQIVTKSEHQQIHWAIKKEAMELYKQTHNFK